MNYKGNLKFQNQKYQAKCNFFEFEAILGIEGLVGLGIEGLVGKTMKLFFLFGKVENPIRVEVENQ